MLLNLSVPRVSATPSSVLPSATPPIGAASEAVTTLPVATSGPSSVTLSTSAFVVGPSSWNTMPGLLPWPSSLMLLLTGSPSSSVTVTVAYTSPTGCVEGMPLSSVTPSSSLVVSGCLMARYCATSSESPSIDSANEIVPGPSDPYAAFGGRALPPLRSMWTVVVAKPRADRPRPLNAESGP